MKRLTCLPYFTQGTVIKGFGRGSKQLGIPTANFPEDVVSQLPSSIENGVYYGFSSVDGGNVHKMVMSIGWNPHFNNEKRSMETHILHEFENDFYNSLMKVIILGFIRPMQSYSSLDELIKAIYEDIMTAQKSLESPEMQVFAKNSHFSVFSEAHTNGSSTMNGIFTSNHDSSSNGVSETQTS